MSIQEPPDHHRYSWVMFYADTVRYLIRAMSFYLERLENEQKALTADPDLAYLLTDDTRREFRVGRDVEYARHIKQWLEGHLEKAGNRFDVDISLDHTTVKILKSVGLLYCLF